MHQRIAKEIDSEKKTLDGLLTKIKGMEEELIKCKDQKERIERSIHKKTIFYFHIIEIYRLASYQFCRLRKKSAMMKEDSLELEKWISRAKSEESLIIIKDALKELDKYNPSEIRGNLYALVQKIISGGAYGQGKKKG